jgi:MoxR-like ATPase
VKREILPDEHGLNDVDELVEKLGKNNYIIDRSNATPIFLAMRLEKPLLIEGPPGCGKTEIAKTIAKSFNLELIRLQCYEGLDYSHAVYEWDYPRQLLEIKLRQETGLNKEGEIRHKIYSENFLLERPLLKSIKSQNRTVLLVDEIDRADPEFEGFLLEFLSEFQITIPELGTIRAHTIPYVFITSNKTRDLSDAVKRRCLYLGLTYPAIEREVEILKKRVKGVPQNLAHEASELVAKVRKDDELVRKPGTAETIDLVSSVLALGASSLEPEILRKTAGTILKDESDLERFLSTL